MTGKRVASLRKKAVPNDGAGVLDEAPRFELSSAVVETTVINGISGFIRAYLSRGGVKSNAVVCVSPQVMDSLVLEVALSQGKWYDAIGVLNGVELVVDGDLSGSSDAYLIDRTKTVFNGHVSQNLPSAKRRKRAA